MYKLVPAQYKQNSIWYNCHIYLTAFKAVVSTANVIGDSATAASASASFEAASLSETHNVNVDERPVVE